MTGLLGKGDMLMKTGDLIIARQFYSRAFQMGAAEGAMGVAKTYDPTVFAEMKVQGITPDAAKAAEWYEKAKAGRRYRGRRGAHDPVCRSPAITLLKQARLLGGFKASIRMF